MKLSAYLDEKKLKPSHFAKQIGVSKVTIHYWLKGERQPKPAVALKIRDATEGLVDLTDLYG